MQTEEEVRFGHDAYSVLESVTRGTMSAEHAVELLKASARHAYRVREHAGLPGAIHAERLGGLMSGAGNAVHSVTIGPCVWCVRLVAMLITGFVSLCVGAGCVVVLVRIFGWLGPHLW